MLIGSVKNCTIAAALLTAFATVNTRPAAAQTSITTYHYDNYRTGWNQTETVLTPANVGSATFGLLKNIAIDDQVDAQPLVVPGVQITSGSFQGTHDVVYVASESNTVYAIDVNSGQVLLSPSFGTPVRYPLGCGNNGPNVGINSTPVIDLSSGTLYSIMYTQQTTGPAYYLHALSLGSLTDKVTPQLVTGSHTLTDGTTYTFNATYQRQRPGLLLANHTIYAGFGSFCDYAADISRGWLLGWTAGTLAPLAANQLTDTQSTSPDNYYLSSIWMSGYGPAADKEGNVLFVTGNSDPAGTTYDGVTDIQESVVKVSSDLSAVLDLFTPSDQPYLDSIDGDFGSGGVMVLPEQPGSVRHMAVAAGKEGNMFLMNEDDLGGFSPTINNVLGTYSIGGCWCGESYFVSPLDGAARVVSSGNTNVMVWKLETTPTVALNAISESASNGGGQAPGFFTTVSSNGGSNPIIWALSHPLNETNAPMLLVAYNPEASGGTLKAMYETPAGNWQNLGGNSNQVPVVANGQVFVASNKQLRIFGLTTAEPK